MPKSGQMEGGKQTIKSIGAPFEMQKLIKDSSNDRLGQLGTENHASSAIAMDAKRRGC